MTQEEIFSKAKDLTEEHRAGFLDKVFHDRPADRAKMEAMLAAHGQTDSLLDIEGQDVTELQRNSSPADPTHIGNYKLLQKIGEGGMGAVYMAEQLQPVKRTVALKVVKAGLDSKQVVARFEAERQSLALMDHPNIAKVLDAGSNERGEPFFVMELVKGTPIHEYCDANRLSTEDRIKLMIDVCNAVQHAHQKGIIHRDLKPSNILVAQYDDRPVPKVIDFGVAKATHQKLTERTLYTQLGQIVGTLEYMSPEQAVLNQLDVDTRTDVYSLGVILYELMVGVTPLDGKQLRSHGLEQILRTIREQEPQRPSMRLSSQGQAATQTAAYRKTDQSSLSQTLRGDLDWVVMKALEKDRSRRYDSVGRLSEDLTNYLNGYTVGARRPTLGYRFKKTWQRYRPIWLSVAGAVCSLLLGVTLLWIQNAELRRILEQRNSALTKWRQSLIMRGIEAGLRGDVSLTERIASDAREANAAEEWVLLILGLAQMNSGNMSGAVSQLAEAYELAPNNLSIASVLTMSLIGDDGAFNIEPNNGAASLIHAPSGHIISRLRHIEPSQEFRDIDLLFRAWTQLYEDPTVSVAALQQLTHEERPWSVTQAMLAMALAHEAADTGDPQVALDALATIRECEPELEGSAFAMFVGLDCRCLALIFAKDHFTQAERTALYSEADNIAKRMGSYPNGWAADFRVAFHELTDAPSTADEYKNVHNDWWCANRTAVLLRLDENWLLENIEPVGTSMSISSIANANALAVLGREKDARRIYKDIAAQPIWPTKVTSLEILLLIKDLDKCQRESKNLLEQARTQSDFWDVPFWVFKKRLRYLSRESGFDETAFLESVRGSKFGECYATFLIGLTFRAKGNAEEARRYFEACVQTKQFWMSQYQFAKSMLQIEHDIQVPPEIVP